MAVEIKHREGEDDVKFEILNVYRVVNVLIPYIKINFKDSEYCEVHVAEIPLEGIEDKNFLREVFLDVWWDYKKENYKKTKVGITELKVGDII